MKKAILSGYGLLFNTALFITAFALKMPASMIAHGILIAIFYSFLSTNLNNLKSEEK